LVTGASGTLRVVVVDDSDDIRDLLRLALERDGRLEIVAQAADGESGLAAISQHRPDIALLDLAMPIKDGLAVLRELQDLDHQTVAIILSGHSSGPPEAEAVELGAAGFIEKGLPLSSMGDAIVELYERARAGV
jgi:DNA-binding NarL/FixJ family response regulator